MKKILYTNGDSWTHGDEITDEEGFKDKNNISFRYYNTWPWFLSQKLGIGMCINEALGGRSNNRIYRRTIDFIMDYVKKGYNTKELLIVLGWTSTERNEIKVNCRETADNKTDSIYVGMTIQNPLYPQTVLDGITERKLKQFNELYYELLDYDLFKTQENTYHYLLTIRMLCNFYNIEYYDFFSVIVNPMKFSEKYPSILTNLYHTTFEHTLWSNNWPYHKFFHPTKESNQNWAEILKNFINEHRI